MTEQAQLTFSEKTHGRWREIFTELITDERFMRALDVPGKHVPSPFNAASEKDGFRLDTEFETKNGLGYCNAAGAMSGLAMVAFMTGQNEREAAHQIHKMLDGHVLDTFKIRTEIKQKQEQRQHRDTQKLECNRELIRQIVNLDKDNSYRDNYLKSRGLEQAIPLINKDLFSVPQLYYDKNTQLPAMVSVVRNEDNKIAFLHRTFLTDQGNKAAVEDVKKVTGKTREDAYQRPHFVQVNQSSSSRHIHVCEGVETALAVTLLTGNKGNIYSAVNANGLSKFMPPKDTQKVFIWADNDKAGIEAADKLQANLHGKVATQVLKPREQGHDFLNQWNKQKAQPRYQRSIAKSLHQQAGLTR